MSEEKVRFLLDLDVKEFTEGVLNAKGTLKSLGSAENISELLEGLTTAGIALGALGVVAYSFKKAIDLTVEAETIHRTNEQFEKLTQSAGISSKTLREGLEESAKGLLTTHDLLEIANKSIIEMGVSAKRLPEILELARKATAVFGGDLKQNFENISDAIARGNTRALKHYGIIVDLNKATRDFAEANGISVNSLSEAGKRQAILNEALEQGKKKYKDINGDMNSATTTLQLLKTAAAELGEAFTIAFGRTIGPLVKAAMLNVKEFATWVKNSSMSVLGDDSEKTAAKIALLESRLKELTLIASGEKKVGGRFFATFRQTADGEIEEVKAKLEELKKKKEELEKKEGKKGGSEPAATADAPEAVEDKDKKLKEELKFQEEMAKIKKRALEDDEKNVQSMEDIDRITKERLLQLEIEHIRRLHEIEASADLNDEQKDALIAAEAEEHQKRIRKDEQETAELRKKLIDQYQKNSTNAFNGISRSFEANGKKNEAELRDMGKLGQTVFDSVGNNAAAAFTKMGEGSATAGEAMKGFMLGALADIAQSEGMLLMLAGIGEMNPLKIAGGGALIALAGYLRSQAGSMGKSSISSGSPDVGSGGSGDYSSGGASGSDSSSVASKDMQSQERIQKSVNINIAGNHYETDATRRQLMEMIRQETDATDFKYNAVGGA